MLLDITQDVAIAGVAPEDFRRLAERLRAEGAHIGGGDSGQVETACFSARYAYDAAVRRLVLEPQRLADGLTPRRPRKTVEQMLAPPRGPFRLPSGTSIERPTPHACATYHWVIGFIVNLSGEVLTHVGSTTGQGELLHAVATIEPGDDAARHPQGCWAHRGSKDSLAGCFGSVAWRLGDGATLLTVTYGSHGLTQGHCSAALTGPAASRLALDGERHAEFCYAAAYLYPCVVLRRA